MTLSEFEQKIERSIQRLDSEIEIEATKAGTDLVALISNRVIQRGETADGGTFTPYSTTPVPAFFYFNKSRNSSANNTVKQKAKKHESLSYKDFRAINNLNTSSKNFEFTGEMWKGFGVLSVEKSSAGVIVTIGGTATVTVKGVEKDKMELNSKQEGRSIIKPSKRELEIVTANLNRWLNSVINGAN